MPPMTSSLAAIDPSNLQPAVPALGRLIVWTACLVVGPYLFFRGLRAFQLKRHVSNLPRCDGPSGSARNSGRSLRVERPILPGRLSLLLVYLRDQRSTEGLRASVRRRRNRYPDGFA